MRITTNIIITLISAIFMAACGQDYSLEEDEAIFSTEEIDRKLTQEKALAEDSQPQETSDSNSVTIVSTEDVVASSEPMPLSAEALPVESTSIGGSPKKVIKIKTKWSAKQ